MNEHDWHLFDANKDYEVRFVEHPTHPWHVRKLGEDVATTLTNEEFNQWRKEGPNPRGLE